jgi:NAD-dependent dihydropyrimidine dehydrogenase PreA subunit
MAVRRIVDIDRDLCNGCGVCTSACAEGALALDGENKAVLVRELYCDGMGVCLNVCPTEALSVIERDSEVYDPQATREHVARTRGPKAAARVYTGPGPGTSADAVTGAAPVPSELAQWPIQLHLISPEAPHFKMADLLVAADCTAFTRGSFHSDLLRGRKLVIACPKLDDGGPYVDKLTELFRTAQPRSVTVALMTVPCCAGLQHVVERSLELSGSALPLHTAIIGLDGEIVLQT